MKRSWVFIVVLILLNATSFAQGFGTDDSVKTIQKEVTAITPPHEYFQLYNYTGDSLPMRWKVDTLRTFYPASWQIALQDNESYFNPIIDSNDFVLPDTTGAMDKIIINVYSNNTVGYGELVIDLINLDSVQDTRKIKFLIDIIPDHSNGIIENLPSVSAIYLIPNPATEVIRPLYSLPVRSYCIFDACGQLVQWERISEGTISQIPVSRLENGWYLISLTDIHEKEYYSRFVKVSF